MEDLMQQVLGSLIYNKTVAQFQRYSRLTKEKDDMLAELRVLMVNDDLNGDGRIGGSGITANIEKATDVDLNRDGIIGGHRPPMDGGLIGKIERATHIDINRDGYIGG